MWQRNDLICFLYFIHFCFGVEVIGNLSEDKFVHGATTVGNRYAIFAGGWTYSGPPGGQDVQGTTTVDIWDSQTRIWSKIALSEGRAYPASTSVGKYALFAGGWRSSAVVDSFSNVVDIW